MQITIRKAVSPADMEGAFAVRRRVFIQEQNIDEAIELDELDATALHVIAMADGKVVATGRMLPDVPGVMRIGRMAVDREYRRSGIGRQVLAFLEAEARRMGMREVLLHAQVPVREFYEKQGYRPQGQPYEEAGVPHINMTKRL